MGRKYFGTDGIRGRVGQLPMTVDFIMKLGWAAGKVFSQSSRGQVVIGKDTRISGYMFESALEAGLAAAGLDVLLLGPMPTPAIAYITQSQRATAGIVISASHNPYHDDGVKFFNGDGFKLPDATEEAIEAMLDLELEMVAPEQIGKATRMEDAKGRYIEFCKSSIAFNKSLRGMKLVIDCAHGATYHIAPTVFRMMDSRGDVKNGDQLLYIIARNKLFNSHRTEGVVGTLMTNLGFEHALQAHGIPFVRAAVGDRYVMAKLVEHGWNLGGESSGHIICLDKTTTGDGIIAALQVLDALISNGQTLTEACSDMEIYPQTMINVPISKALDLNNSPLLQDAVKSAEVELADAGRVLLRASGTEPLIRVMVEGQDSAQVENIAAELAQSVRDTAGI
jgi:phosphoglucosamine mutase